MYPCAVKVDRYVGTCNTLNNLSNKICVSNKTGDLNITKNIYHANVNVNLIEENLIQIKSGIMINVDVSVKNIIYVKNIISGILLHTVVKMENI